MGRLFTVITDLKDWAMFLLMLRCGLRVEEVAKLIVDSIEYPRRRLLVLNGWNKTEEPVDRGP